MNANDTAQNSAPQGSTPQPRKSLKLAAWWSVAALGAGLLVSVALPLSSALFPAEDVISCTVRDDSGELRGRRNLGRLHSRVHTTCGTFRSKDITTCTADPGLKTQLVTGFTYDLKVRGADLPFTLSREIVSATLSDHQKFSTLGSALDTELPSLTPDTDDPELNKILEDIQNRPESREIDEKIAKFKAEFAPETLRAFDYEQPPFTPACDVMRQVMTAKGLQIMHPVRAAETLTPPEGTTPREPLLPCEGYGCEPTMGH